MDYIKQFPFLFLSLFLISAIGQQRVIGKARSYMFVYVKFMFRRHKRRHENLTFNNVAEGLLHLYPALNFGEANRQSEKLCKG